MRTLCRLTAALLLFASALPALGAESETGLSLIESLEPPAVLSAVISPDGKHIAIISFSGTNQGLTILNTDDLSSKEVYTGRWVPYGQSKFLKAPRQVRWITNGLMAVDYGLEADARDLEGKHIVDLGTRVIGKAVPSDPNSPLVLVYSDDDHERVAMVNTKTRKSRTLGFPMSGTPVRFAFDEQGELRALTLSSASFWNNSTLMSHWYRSSSNEEWTKLAEFKVTDEIWTPLAVEGASNRLIVSSRLGRDTLALFSYDPIKREIGEMLAGHPSEDVLVLDDLLSENYESVLTAGMKPVRYWFNARWAGLQKAVDSALPNRINFLSGDPHGKVLVKSYSDVDPGQWLLLDTSKMSLRKLLDSNPQIKPAKMRPMELINYPSLDGMNIPAYLTRPAGETQKRAMVVMVHGGPASRDAWKWDSEVQLLASQGYLVLQPQFRGSSGFGRKFETAGYGQWGRAMQDDITAGVQHLIQQGIADPKRICIYGASYGGYAALWGLIKTPELYQCGISFAGVSDIEYLLNASSDANDNKLTRELLRFQVGEQDKLKLAEVSPLKNAQRIQAPLLIAHGDADKRVPISHSRKMMRELDKYGKTYEWVQLEDEGHGVHLIKNQYKLSSAMLKFLERYIGDSRSPDNESTPSSSSK